MALIYSFRPFVSARCRVLILGSMPGEASLKAAQYYAHPRNAFWPIMGELFGAGWALPYEERIRVLDKAGVALWDVLQACHRPGSLDSAITGEMPNDFVTLFAAHPDISHVFFNGAKAEGAFRRQVLPGLSDESRLYTRLPSTSPARAGMSLAAKVDAWRIVAVAAAIVP